MKKEATVSGNYALRKSTRPLLRVKRNDDGNIGRGRKPSSNLTAKILACFLRDIEPTRPSRGEAGRLRGCRRVFPLSGHSAMRASSKCTLSAVFVDMPRSADGLISTCIRFPYFNQAHSDVRNELAARSSLTKTKNPPCTASQNSSIISLQSHLI